LLCDVWQPGSGIEHTGLAMIYLHPGGWQNVDKDTGTLPFFSYLVAKGHLVMDVSYRLCHETDMWGMIGDVKRAIAWMKANAGEYGVDPERVVVSGGSAGGHLALLAGYTPNHPQLDPEDVRGGTPRYGPLSPTMAGPICGSLDWIRRIHPTGCSWPWAERPDL
jgi:acetyl esterase/lipase